MVFTLWLWLGFSASRCSLLFSSLYILRVTKYTWKSSIIERFTVSTKEKNQNSKKKNYLLLRIDPYTHTDENGKNVFLSVSVVFVVSLCVWFQESFIKWVFSLGSAESVLSAVNMCVLQSLFTRLIVWTGVAEMFKRHEYPYKCLFSFEICRDNLLAHLVVLRLTASIGYPRVGVFNVCFVRFRFYRMRALCPYYFVASIQLFVYFSSLVGSLLPGVSLVSKFESMLFFVYGYYIGQCFVLYHQELVILSQFYLWCLLRNKFGSVAFFSSAVLLKLYKITNLNGRLVGSLFSGLFCFFNFLVLFACFSSIFSFQFVRIFCLFADSWKMFDIHHPQNALTISRRRRRGWWCLVCVCVSVCNILLSAMQCVHSTQPFVISATSIFHASLNLVLAWFFENIVLKSQIHNLLCRSTTPTNLKHICIGKRLRWFEVEEKKKTPKTMIWFKCLAVEKKHGESGKIIVVNRIYVVAVIRFPVHNVVELFPWKNVSI